MTKTSEPDQTSLSLPTVPETQLVDEWLSYCEKANDLSEATIKAYRKGIKLFAQWLRESGQGGIVTPSTILAFKADLKERYSPQTVNLRLTAIRSFYRWLVLTERIPISPATEIKGAKRRDSKRHKRDRLANGEVLALFETCDDSRVGVRDRAILSILAYCGPRVIEVHRAKVGDLRTVDDRLVLYVQGKTGDRDLVIPYHQEPVIRAWLAKRRRIKPYGPREPLFVSLSNRSRGTELTTRSITAMFQARCEVAGIVGKTIHGLRHSAATSALRHGATPLQVQAMLGHKSFDTTLIYVHEASRLAAPAEDLIDYHNANNTAKAQ